MKPRIDLADFCSAHFPSGFEVRKNGEAGRIYNDSLRYGNKWVPKGAVAVGRRCCQQGACPGGLLFL